MRRPTALCSLASAVCLALFDETATAQPTSNTGRNLPLHRVEILAHTDSGVFRNIYNVHVLSDGSVLAVDATQRRLLVLDSTLKRFRIAADTAGAGAISYGLASGGLIPFIGDSAAFIDQSAGALIAVDRNGKFGRVMSMPVVGDMRYLGGPTYGKPGFDARGRLFYRAQLSGSTARPGATGRDTTYVAPDSAPIIRADFDVRRLDTIAWMRVATVQTRRFSVEGGWTMTAVANPLQVIDDWAYDRDGAVAIVRGRTYHIDWILPDGSRRSTPRMPFDWRRITDDEKQRIVDSVRRTMDSTRQALADRMAENARQTGTTVRPYVPPPSYVVEPNELPDYYPSVKANSRPRFDLDGNLWVIPGTVAVPLTDGGLVYDVVNREGTILKRVQIPEGRVLSGFAPGGIIYMTRLTTSGGYTRFERARILASP